MSGMIDVGEKEKTKRVAKAWAFVKLTPEIVTRIKANEMPKGNVLEAARLAGILGGKKTPELLPLCHALETDAIHVDFKVREDGIEIITEARAHAKTGVEMEALVAASTAALTIYDMSKMYSKEIVIGPIELLEKSGGKTGDYKKQ